MGRLTIHSETKTCFSVPLDQSPYREPEYVLNGFTIRDRN